MPRRIGDDNKIGFRLRKGKAAGEGRSLRAVRQADGHIPVAVGVDRISIGLSRSAGGCLAHGQDGFLQVNDIGFGFRAGAVAHIVRGGDGELIYSRCIGTGGEIGAVAMIGQDCRGLAPLRRDGLHAGAAVRDGDLQRHLLGIRIAGQLGNGDGRGHGVQLADRGLTGHGLAVEGQRKGVKAVGHGAIAAAGAGDRHAPIGRGRHTVGIGGAGMKIPGPARHRCDREQLRLNIVIRQGVAGQAVDPPDVLACTCSAEIEVAWIIDARCNITLSIDFRRTAVGTQRVSAAFLAAGALIREAILFMGLSFWLQEIAGPKLPVDPRNGFIFAA